MPYYKNGMKAAFSIVLLLTKIQKGFIKFLEPADCGMFCPNSIAVVRYGALIRAKYTTNCDAHLAEILFQTRSSQIHINHKIYIIQRQYNCPKSISNYKQVNFHTVIHSSYLFSP